MGLVALIAIVISICFMAHYTQKQAQELATLNSKLDQLIQILRDRGESGDN